MPVSATTMQYRIVYVSDIPPFPKALGILGVKAHARALGAKIGAHQVYEAGNHRGSRPVHAQNQNLHWRALAGMCTIESNGSRRIESLKLSV